MSRFAGGVLVAAVLLVVLLVAGAVNRRAPDGRPAGGLRVVATTPVLYSLTAKALGSTDGLSNLIPPGASPENYALRPQDAQALAQADVVVVNGLGFEQLLQGPLAEAERQGKRVVTASAGVPTVGTPPNPHLWLDPLRAAQMVQTIVDGLAAADPASAPRYRARAAAARASLELLDAELRAQLHAASGKSFVAFHPAWVYFAERYGLEQAAVIEEFPGKEPTAQQLADVVSAIRQKGVRAILSEPQLSPRVAEALARDLGLRVHEVNPEGGDLAIDGYERLMRENAQIFVRALNGR